VNFVRATIAGRVGAVQQPAPLLAATNSGAPDEKAGKMAPAAVAGDRRARIRAARPTSSGPGSGRGVIVQFPSAWPNAPEDAQGIARTLSRGLPSSD
jgi:hypothetical protein